MANTRGPEGTNAVMGNSRDTEKGMCMSSWEGSRLVWLKHWSPLRTESKTKNRLWKALNAWLRTLDQPDGKVVTTLFRIFSIFLKTRARRTKV